MGNFDERQWGISVSAVISVKVAVCWEDGLGNRPDSRHHRLPSPSGLGRVEQHQLVPDDGALYSPARGSRGGQRQVVAVLRASRLLLSTVRCRRSYGATGSNPAGGTT